ncbi:cell division protein FtsQ/DivIB [Amycolatopsis minnesotensis]|uniref:Cell division protein FtsQ n=1 Tax=Amycolatopsis minnesotensis TaxID=337894 RepID=A0ABN2Q4K5_9PSEU
MTSTRTTTRTAAKQRADRRRAGRARQEREPVQRRGRRSSVARQRTGTRPSRRKALRRRWVALLTVLALAGIGYVVFFTSLLGVKSVEVSGASGSVTADGVRAAAAVPDRIPLIRLDTDGVRERVLAMPGVATAEVSRSWPNTVEVTVTERTPVAYFNSGDALHLVDGGGVVFKVVKDKPAGLPEIKLPRVGPEDPLTRAVTGVLAAVPLQLRTQVVAVGAATPGSVELTLATGKTVRWGDASQGDRKAKVLAALLTRDGKTYDVSAPELPTIS